MLSMVKMRRGSRGYVKSHQFRKYAYAGSGGIQIMYVFNRLNKNLEYE